MPHVRPLSLENAPPDAQPILKAILKAIEQKFGKPLNITADQEGCGRARRGHEAQVVSG